VCRSCSYFESIPSFPFVTGGVGCGGGGAGGRGTAGGRGVVRDGGASKFPIDAFFAADMSLAILELELETIVLDMLSRSSSESSSHSAICQGMNGDIANGGMSIR